MSGSAAVVLKLMDVNEDQVPYMFTVWCVFDGNPIRLLIELQ